jgi:thiamine biosynthesis lipoprotein
LGTVCSIQLIRGPEEERSRFDDAARRCWTELHEIERHFSPWLEDSDIRRLARSEIKLRRTDRRVREVEALCQDALERTDGLFDAWREGWFDPTGLVRGWAADRVAEHYLAPLLKQLGASAVGLNVGGDLRLFTAATSAWRWRVGLTDPTRPDNFIATVELLDGAVATSGLAERGERVIDPRTGLTATTVASATVMADRLTEADLWATTAVASGFDDLSWITRAQTRSGLLIAPDGAVRRWIGQVALS